MTCATPQGGVGRGAETRERKWERERMGKHTSCSKAMHDPGAMRGG